MVHKNKMLSSTKTINLIQFSDMTLLRYDHHATVMA